MRRAVRIIIAATALLGASFATADERKRHPLAHVVHITASLTFDGKPVRIDDLIDCYASYTGTPTSSPHMVFKPNRGRITHEVPGGGMISFRVSRELCYVNGDQWGSALPSYTAPPEWTPVLEWYDDRDVLKRTEGILYMSETALKNPDGRLKITEPFVVSTPEHPASDALLDEVQKQSVERDWYQGRNFSTAEQLKLSRRPMEWMVRISKEDWSDPLRARPNHKFKNRDGKRTQDHFALARILEGLKTKRIVSLGYGGDLGSADVVGILIGLRQGQRPVLSNIFEFGVPMQKSERFGLLLNSHKFDNIARTSPYFRNIFDDLIPFKCLSGIVTSSEQTPGLRYWYQERCSHPDFYEGHSIFGNQVNEETPVRHGKLLFVGATKDLWWISGGQ